MAEHVYSTTPPASGAPPLTTRRPLAAAALAAVAAAFVRPAESAVITVGHTSRRREVLGRPDAELLALALRLKAALDDVNASEMAGEDLPPGLSDASDALDEWVSRSSTELSDACRAIVDMPPAQTTEGRALKAAAAMYKLRDAAAYGIWPGSGEELAWLVLSEVAGETYVPPRVPPHLADIEPERA